MYIWWFMLIICYHKFMPCILPYATRMLTLREFFDINFYSLCHAALSLFLISSPYHFLIFILLFWLSFNHEKRQKTLNVEKKTWSAFFFFIHEIVIVIKTKNISMEMSLSSQTHLTLTPISDLFSLCTCVCVCVRH